MLGNHRDGMCHTPGGTRTNVKSSLGTTSALGPKALITTLFRFWELLTPLQVLLRFTKLFVGLVRCCEMTGNPCGRFLSLAGMERR